MFSPATTGFWGSLTVTISCRTEGAIIRYTIDGSTPTPSSGTVYDGPFNLLQSATVRAIACLDGLEPSNVISIVYTNGAPNVGLTISDLTADGSLAVAETSLLTVSCKVQAMGCYVTSVVADLSEVGGSATESLVFSQNHWTWTGEVTPSTVGLRTIRIAARQDKGLQITADTAFTVGPANVRPAVTAAVAVGDLAQSRTSTLMVVCAASDPDGTITDATADFSAVGGSRVTPMIYGDGKYFASGQVTPTEPGEKTVTITLTDNKGGSTAVTTTVVVGEVGRPPVIANQGVAGSLTVGLPAAIAVTCEANDPDGAVGSVTANLSVIGGSPSQVLTAAGNQWTWSGTLTPAIYGNATITFTATDNLGVASTAIARIQVGASTTLPWISNTTLMGPLVCNTSCTVTVSCIAGDPDGTLQSVVVDLSAIGGSGAQSLDPSGSTWTWTGSVTPFLPGSKSISFVATDDDGNIAGGTATASAVATRPGFLAGTWSGNVNYTHIWDEDPRATLQITLPQTRVFQGDYQPETLAIFFMDPHLICIPAQSLRNVGDQGTFVVPGPLPSLSPCTVAATVRSVYRSTTAFSIELDLMITLPSRAPLPGTYHWQATLDAGDRLIWSETARYPWSLSIDVTAKGTLVRR
jgi:uncharacterized protein YndB with AHSA1/START domain